jgi:Mor family transcriptional regulator
MTTDMVTSVPDHRRHELLADVAEQAALQLIRKHGIAEDVAVDLGNHLADFLSDHWHGQNVYMIADAKFKLSKRDMQIYERLQRGNAHELAKEFNISYVRVHQIYKRCLVAMRKRVQPALFADEPEELSTGSKR